MSNKKALGLELKKKNRNRIYRFIYANDCVTKQDIVHSLQLSLPTITQNLTELMEEGLIYQSGSIGNTGGRRARGYKVSEDIKIAAGIDINKKHFSIVILDLKGNVIKKQKNKIVFANSEMYFKTVGNTLNQMIDEISGIRDKILGVGICVQGIISSDGSEVLYGKISNITGLKLEDYRKFISYPVRLFHDADAAAFAELWSEKSIQNAIYVSLSTNLGSSVIINREIYAGEQGFGGKIEHMILKEEGKECYCGKKGCAECYCSVSSLLESAKDKQLSIFFDRLKSGNKKQEVVWNLFKKDLSVVLNNLRMLFDCDLILGGYMGEYLEEYMEDIKKEVYIRNSFPWDREYVRLCKYKTEPVAAGAALKFIDEFLIST